MLKKLIIFSFLSFLFSFSYASIVDPDKGKSEKEQKCKKKYGAFIERASKMPSGYTGTEKIVKEKQQKAIEEGEQGFSAKQEQKADIHSFNFLYYLIHHYKFSDFITE